MNIKIVQGDIEQLDQEIEACKTAGLEEIFFKFQDSDQWFRFNHDQASHLLVTLQALLTAETLFVYVDIDQLT